MTSALNHTNLILTRARSARLQGWQRAWRRRRSPTGRSRGDDLCRHRLLEILVDLVEEAGGGEPLLVGADQEREVLGHGSGLYSVDRDPLKRFGELRQLRVAIELGAM